MTWTIYAQSINEFLPPSLCLLPRTPTLMFLYMFFGIFFFFSGVVKKSQIVELNLWTSTSSSLSSYFNNFLRWVFFIFYSGWMSQFFGITFNQVLWKKNEMNIIVYTNKLFKKWDLFFAFVKSMVVCC